MAVARNLPLSGALCEFPEIIPFGVQKDPGIGGDGESDYFPIQVSRAPYRRWGPLAIRIPPWMCDVPVFTGESLRPQWPPSDAYARAMLLPRKPWMQASDIREDSSATWAPEFNLFLELDTCPLALKVNVGRAKAVTRAMGPRLGWPNRPRLPTQMTMTRRTHGYTGPPPPR